MKEKQSEKKGFRMLSKIIIVAVFVFCVSVVINLAPNYIKDELQGKVNVIINNSNVTKSLKFDAFVDEKENVYLSTKDIANFFDDNIFYDNKYNQIITTSKTKVATLEIGNNEIDINGSKKVIYASAMEKDKQFYLPISELETVYNIEVEYVKDTKIVTIDSLDREQKKANSSKNQTVRYLPTFFSKGVDNINAGESVIVISENVDGYVKIRTKNGIIGYVKDVANIHAVRENMTYDKQIEGKISLVWDYFSEYASAPSRKGTSLKGVNVVSPTFVTLVSQGDGKIDTNIGKQGQEYITWAHENGYKVWPSFSNNSYKQTTSAIINDYKLRQTLITNIVNVALANQFDGVNLDFENIYMADKDMFTRFVIELAPRLREYGMVLSVDVTAPDGSEDWSMCYDRNELAKQADYLVFMAYDEHNAESTEAGTTAGVDWIEVALKKFVGTQEEVPAEKLILGMPFYTRVWKEQNGELSSYAIFMKSIDSTIPSNVQRVWKDDVKQNYVEYTRSGATYKIWIEDDKSIAAKCDLVNDYNLAGAAYWSKDRETPSVWNVISEKLNVK